MGKATQDDTTFPLWILLGGWVFEPFRFEFGFEAFDDFTFSGSACTKDLATLVFHDGTGNPLLKLIVDTPICKATKPLLLRPNMMDPPVPSPRSRTAGLATISRGSTKTRYSLVLT